MYGDFDFQVKHAAIILLFIPPCEGSACLFCPLFFKNISHHWHQTIRFSCSLSLQSRKYYFLSEEPEEKENLSQRCRDLQHQVCWLTSCLEHIFQVFALYSKSNEVRFIFGNLLNNWKPIDLYIFLLIYLYIFYINKRTTAAWILSGR